MAQERSESCLTRTIYASVAGGGFGSILGAITATWSDVPKVIRNKSWPAFKQTGVIMIQQGGLFAALGAAFAAGDCAAESLRGKRDIWNGVYGGFASGAVMGLRSGSIPVAISAGTALAVVSAIVDTAGEPLSERGAFDDGLTPPPQFYPYPQNVSRGNS